MKLLLLANYIGVSTIGVALCYKQIQLRFNLPPISCWEWLMAICTLSFLSYTVACAVLLPLGRLERKVN